MLPAASPLTAHEALSGGFGKKTVWGAIVPKSTPKSARYSVSVWPWAMEALTKAQQRSANFAIVDASEEVQDSRKAGRRSSMREDLVQLNVLRPWYNVSHVYEMGAWECWISCSHIFRCESRPRKRAAR